MTPSPTRWIRIALIEYHRDRPDWVRLSRERIKYVATPAGPHDAAGIERRILGNLDTILGAPYR